MTGRHPEPLRARLGDAIRNGVPAELLGGLDLTVDRVLELLAEERAAGELIARLDEARPPTALERRRREARR